MYKHKTTTSLKAGMISSKEILVLGVIITVSKFF